MYKNLRTYLELLEKSSEVEKITVQVSPDREISEIVDRISKEPDGGKALLFENTGTDFPVLCNMMGSQKRMALALGLNNLDELPLKVGGLLDALMQPRETLAQKLSILPILGSARKWFPKHSRRKGKCQEVIYKGSEVNLSILPILKSWPQDAERFITLPLVHTVDLESGARNVGMYRMQVLDDQTTAMHWHIHKTGARHYEQYRKAKKRMPVSICIGGDPVYTYAATAPLPDGIDEYLLAGFLRHKPVKLVRCVTNNIEVPSDCDFVIEGYIDPEEAKIVEGPFGDHTGFYSLPDLYPVLHVTAITHKSDAIFPATLVGVPPQEDRYIAEASEKIFAEPIKAVVAQEVKNLWMPWQGVAHNCAVVEIEKSFEGQGIKVASALWGAGQMSFCKLVWITETPVSENELREMLLGKKSFTAEVILSSGIADILDHAGETMGLGGKICVDTTSSVGAEWRVEPTFDDGAEELTDDERMWLLLANIDPVRDIELTDNVMKIDARSKELKNRDFPNIVTMDDETIAKVDSRWSEYGLGEFIASPSRRYKKLLKGDGAEQKF